MRESDARKDGGTYGEHTTQFDEDRYGIEPEGKREDQDTPLARLRHHITGAIERGEKQAIVGIPADQAQAAPAHTPGPWEAAQEGHNATGWPIWVVLGPESALCKVYTYGEGDNPGQAEANARLIAAAPETAARLAQVEADLAGMTEHAHGLEDRLLKAEAQGDALLAALRDIIEAADDPDNAKDRDLVAAIDWDGARAAITSAEGRAG